jgi:malic enzyme
VSDIKKRFKHTESDSPTACVSIDAQAVNAEIALAVIKQAIDEGVSNLNVPDDELRRYLDDRIWQPEYPDYEYTKDGQSF